MTASQNPLVIGIFQDEAKAKQVLTELNNAGFAKDQLGFANTEGETANTNLGSELMKFGVPQEHAGYYHNAFQAGQNVVSVRADGREQDAARILSNYGATGLNSDPNAGTAMPNDASQMAAYNTYVDPSQNAANQAPAYPAGNYNNSDSGMANQQQYNDPNYNNAGMANQQTYNDPNYNNSVNQQQAYANPNYNNQNYSNAGMANTDQSYSNDQQQYNNAGYANNDPNQGFNQAQNYDPNAFQNNTQNAEQERRVDREERRMEREERENNNF
ncbi:hypothetical protein [Dictyobacter formicarum]|uniref:General stress protein 17M-like domain-containing protein n=1 Tax=Dictyobacter formicarum TaxID=2778368 RepID=A0ABQ3VI81_9CHLR|nr:hypothetical protein [Dictyobacter formicarum]GHO85399.1 hypothetical protein KSZ_34050 [Dictyobacter formicarum]